MPESSAKPGAPGPFRLLKYFMISGFVVIAVVTFLLGAFLYSRSLDTMLKSAENYARLLAENLNYNIYIGYYAPLKARSTPMDLTKWDQFGALDSLIKDFTYGQKIQRIRIIDPQNKIIYSTDYDQIGKFEPPDSPVQAVLNGKDVTTFSADKKTQAMMQANWIAATYYPLREVTGNYWMLGNVYGVIEISQDVTDQYLTVRRSVYVVILVAAGLMAFLFIMLALIVRRGERILLLRAIEQKKLEEQLQQSEKMASIGQMIAVVAHEIRNPLGIIKSSAEMLSKKVNPDPSRIKRLSQVIMEEATRLSVILTDFLDFAKPRSPILRDLNIQDVLSRVRENLETELVSRNIEWIDRPTNGTSPIVQGDPDLLYQAFLNIAMNGFEAMKSGGKLEVEILRQNGTLNVTFSDDGHGISDEHLSKIFTPFFTTNQMGTGLGLSVVHNIISAHSGTIEVETKPGEGTSFHIRLPVQE